MDRNSQPPSGDVPERPVGETPQPEQPSQSVQGGFAPPPGYAPPPRAYSPTGQSPTEQPGYPPSEAAPGRPPDAPPPEYSQLPGPPQGYPPPGYGRQAQRGGMPAWAWVLIGMVVVIIIGCVGVIAVLTFLGTRVDTTFSAVGSALLP